MNSIVKKILCRGFAVIFSFLFIFESIAMADMKIKGECMNDKGKMSSCEIENQNELISIIYGSKKYAHLNRTIHGGKITNITGGEYAKRRVGTGVALALLVSPLGLFALLSKKKRDTFGIEYLNENDRADSIFIQTGKKYGHALKTMLQSASGKDVVYEAEEKK